MNPWSMNLIAGCIHWIDEKKDAGRVKEAVAGMKGDPGMSLEKNALWFGIGQNQFNILQLRLSLVARLFYSRFQCFALHVGFLATSELCDLRSNRLEELEAPWHGGAMPWQR